MRLFVCIKEVIDARAPLGALSKTGSFDETATMYVPNPGDLVALEAALRLKEDCGSGEVIVITVGPARTETTLRVCLSLGADAAIRIDAKGRQIDDSVLVSKLIARYISSGPIPDLILLGMESLDCSTGQVPAHLASQLDLPLVCAATAIATPDENGRMRARRKLERGDQVSVAFESPAVITVDVGSAEPRYASLPALVSALGAEIAAVTPVDLGFSQAEILRAESWLSSGSLVPPRRRPKKVYAPSSSLSPAERMKQLMSGGVTQKKGEMWKGTPEEIADRLLQLLVDERVIEDQSKK